ncbi:MAG: ABC transporter ATP-binding protein [Rectinemataceae bacterium]|jgi:simple sugar transport system ATP-binding protein
MDLPFLEIREVTKLFSQVVANKRVSFSIRGGEVVALLGENGAGKSTIMKILYGLYRADSGSILIEGKEVRIASPKDAMALGISMIQQHFSLVPTHSVTENVILGSARGLIDRRDCTRRIGELAAEYGFDVDPAALIRDLPVGVQQKVEILKALFQRARLLIMDEPTAVLTPQEAEALMAFVRSYAERGNTVIFITHKLKEVMGVADRIIVMRNGEVHGDLPRAGTNELELSRLMIGRELPPLGQGPAVPEAAQELLRLERLSVRDRHGIYKLKDVSFSIRRGEILGIAGVSGNGQQELCEAVCGSVAPSSGRILLDGEDIARLSIRERMELGLGYVPADRQKDGMVMEMSLAENMILKSSFEPRWAKGPFLDRWGIAEYARTKIEAYSIKAPGPEAIVKGLSGGNQQKLVVAREVDNGRRLIVFDQPTRGLDLGAIAYVHASILRERLAGKCILLISTELSEIFALSDRIAVLYKGAIQGIFPKAELSIEGIGLLMAGYSLRDEELQR